MNDADIREISETRAATSLNAATIEPSHIHIPRPSRLARSGVTPAAESASEPTQLDLTLQKAA